MLEYDVLMKELERILMENIVCEDNELHLKCKLKYDFYNVMCKHNKNFVDRLKVELEYEEENNGN